MADPRLCSGMAGTRPHRIWSNSDLVQHITSFCCLIDLHGWRQCNKMSWQCSRECVRRPSGICAQFWRHLRRLLPGEITDAMDDFVRTAQSAAVTGSSVLQFLTADPSWNARDLDVIAVLNAPTIHAFLTLLRRLAQSPECFSQAQQAPSLRGSQLPGLLRLITTHNSLNAPPGVCASRNVLDRLPPTREAETEQAEELQEEVGEVYFTHVRQRRAEGSGVDRVGQYEKHVRSLYYTLHLLDPATRHLCRCERDDDDESECPAVHYHVDVLFVPESDVLRSGVYLSLSLVASLGPSCIICTDGCIAQAARCTSG